MAARLARHRARGGGIALVLATGIALAGCSDKKAQDSVGDTGPAVTPSAPPVDGRSTPPGASSPDGSSPPATAADTTLPAFLEAPESDAEPTYGGELVFAGEAEVGLPWTPALMQCDSFCYQRAGTFYDTLTTINSDLEWEPYLAESIEPNADSTAFTITVRRGVTFHDGTPLDADAVIYNLNEAVTSLLTGPALQDIAKNPDGTLVVEKHDDLTFTIFTGRGGNRDDPMPWPLLPYGLSLQVAYIASPTWLQAVKDGTASPTDAVGTGPFKIDRYRPGDSLHVVRNDDYWLQAPNGDQLPYLDAIEFRVVPDALVRQQALESGDVDVVSTSDGHSLSQLVADAGFETLLQDRYTETSHIMLHAGKEGSPLGSREVRCALTQGVDLVEMNEILNNGFNTPANGPFSPGQEGYLADSGMPAFDPEAASAAIEAYEAEHGPVRITYSTVATSTSLSQAQFVQDAWEAVGVDVTVDQIEQSELITNAVMGSDSFDAFGWRNHAGFFVDGQTHWWSSRTALPPGQLALNFGRIRDEAIDRNLRAARESDDPAFRQRAGERINRRFAEQCYLIPAWYTTWGIVHTPQVENLGRLPLPSGNVSLAAHAGRTSLTAAFVSG